MERLLRLLVTLERDFSLEDVHGRLGSLLNESRRDLIDEAVVHLIYTRNLCGRALRVDLLAEARLNALEKHFTGGLIVHSGNLFQECQVVLQVHTAAIISQVKGFENGVLSDPIGPMARGIDTDHMVYSGRARYSNIGGLRKAELQVRFDFGCPSPCTLLSHMAHLFSETNVKGQITAIKLVARFDFQSHVYNRDTSILEFKACWEGSPVCDAKENELLHRYVYQACSSIRDYLYQKEIFYNFRLLKNMDWSLNRLACPCNGPDPCLGFDGTTLCSNPLENCAPYPGNFP